MIEAPHYSPAGARKKSGFALPVEYFDGQVNEPVMHQAVKVFLNNQRQGTHMTKTRSFVSGGNQKPWKQKGTGRARQGSIRAPHWRGGGIVFGPSPRDYRTDIPRKVRQLARRSALNARAAGGQLFVVEQLQFAGPKTAQFAELLDKFGIAGRKTLVLTHGMNSAVYLSSRNIPGVRVMTYGEAAAYDILWAEVVVVEEGAFSGEPPVPYMAPESAEAPAKSVPGARAARPAPSKPKAPAAPAKAVKAKTKTRSEKPAAKSAGKGKAGAQRAPSKSERKSAPKKKGGR